MKPMVYAIDQAGMYQNPEFMAIYLLDLAKRINNPSDSDTLLAVAKYLFMLSERMIHTVKGEQPSHSPNPPSPPKPEQQ